MVILNFEKTDFEKPDCENKVQTYKTQILDWKSHFQGFYTPKFQSADFIRN